MFRSPANPPNRVFALDSHPYTLRREEENAERATSRDRGLRKLNTGPDSRREDGPESECSLARARVCGSVFGSSGSYQVLGRVV